MSQRVQNGRITKVVRVPVASGGSNSDDLEGYGILRSELGTDVFFVGAVAEQEFKDLEVGDSVCFTLEPGPFARASKVWVQAAELGRAFYS